jgi:iron complex outermembrane receptor protein
MKKQFYLFAFKAFVYLLIFYLPGGCIALNAQTIKDATKLEEDSIHIEEVEISAKNLSKFQAGAKIESINPRKLELQKDGNLTDLLSLNMPLPIKANAGGLSTIRIRGTAPDHTSINFGGINLNSLTLGHSNVCNIPVYLFDEIDLQYGSSSTVNGSGSIGGAIHLILKENWTNGHKVELRSAIGSFGEQHYGTKIFVGNGRIESVSRFYFYYKNNNFKFFNTSVKDFTTDKIGVEDVQRNAEIKNYGVLQEINYRFNTQETFKFSFWLEDDWHNVQQNQATNILNPEFKENYEDKHLRIWTNYDNKKKELQYHIGAGYVYDNGISNNSPNPIKTSRFIGEASVERNVLKNGSFKTGTKATRIYPDVYAYSEDLDYEDQIDFYFSYYHDFFNKLRVSFNLRQGFVTGFKSPFVPSFGLSYRLFYTQKAVLKINGNLAKSYRVPTFNERYWIPGGNPDLLPESGLSYELGLDYNYSNQTLKNSIKINLFYMDVDNWLLWRNGGAYWYAENVQNVFSKGIEAQLSLKSNSDIFELGGNINCSYTNSKRTKSINESSAIGRQLEYVPLYAGTASLFAGNDKLFFTIDGNYTYEQYTDETYENILPQYFLLNTSASYNFKIKENNRFRIGFILKNILNKNYQSTIDYAMPRINYRISLTYNLN